MALRAKKPGAVTKRLKMLMFGPAGVGKTTAAIQFPKSYIIDAERGSENYDKLVSGSGSVVFQTTDINEVLAEIRSLLTEKHDFRTLVIDPITPLYMDLLDKCELKVGSEFGRHYGEAKKTIKRLNNLLMSLDMNVIVTSHAKTEYGSKLEKLGITFDGPKGYDYVHDLVVELGKQGKRRFGRVVKTRIETFPDGDAFDWSYDEVKRRYEQFAGAGILDREAAVVTLATAEQVAKLKELLGSVRMPDDWAERCLSKAGVESWEDMPGDIIEKCITAIMQKIPNAANAA